MEDEGIIKAAIINQNCYIYRCVPNENYGLSDEDFRDTDTPTLQEPIKDPARLEWHEACLPKPRRRQVTKVAHYYLSVNAMTRPDLPAGRQVQMREDEAPYRTGDQ